MFRYIFRQFQQGMKKKYTLYYIVGMLILCVLANISMLCFRKIYGMNDGSFGYNLIVFAEGVFVIPYYSCIFLSDIIFGKEYPNPYIRDSANHGLKRWQLYIGKMLSSVLMGAVLFFITFFMLLVTTFLFSMNDGTIETWVISDFMSKALVALPLWVAGISIGQCFLFCSGNKTKAIIYYFLTVLVIPRVIMLLASEKIALPPFTGLTKLLLTPQFNDLQFYFTMDIGKAYISGAVYILISTAIGIYAFYKRKF